MQVKINRTELNILYLTTVHLYDISLDIITEPYLYAHIKNLRRSLEKIVNKSMEGKRVSKQYFNIEISPHEHQAFASLLNFHNETKDVTIILNNINAKIQHAINDYQSYLLREMDFQTNLKNDLKATNELHYSHNQKSLAQSLHV
jgi:predicted RNA-binding protein Jag